VNTDRTQRRTVSWFVVAGTLLFLSFGVSLAIGAVSISLSEIVSWATGRMPDEQLAGRVLTGVRLPRSLAAVIVGAMLGVGGAALQGVHRTRIIDAHLIGISAAAGLGVALGYAFAPSGYGPLTAVTLAVLAGVGFALVSRLLGNPGGGAVGLVLMGIAAGLAITAWTGLFVLAIDSPAVPTLSFFIFGSLVGVNWITIGLVVPVALAGVGLLWWIGPGLDLLSLGEQISVHLGFDARRRVPLALAAIGAIVAASVALGGVIGFVGLVVPLAVRPVIGSALRLLIPASAIGGAIAVLLLDTLARTLVAPIEIPLGLLTAALGGPVLVWLVRRETIQ